MKLLFFFFLQFYPMITIILLVYYNSTILIYIYSMQVFVQIHIKHYLRLYSLYWYKHVDNFLYLISDSKQRSIVPDNINYKGVQKKKKKNTHTKEEGRSG